jgi:Xaa-Pro aminopeptidase
MGNPRRIVPAFAALLGGLLLFTNPAPARVRQPNEEYQARRANLRAQVDGPVVLFGYTGHEDSSALARFFQEENFYYLTGHNEPGAALLLIPNPPGDKTVGGPREILFLPPRNPMQERWVGPKLGPDDADIAQKTGFAAVEPFANLRGELEKLGKVFPNLYTPLPGSNDEGYPHKRIWSDWLKEAAPQAHLKDTMRELAAMRQVKSPGEIALLQKAVDVSVDAHFDAMKRMRPGLYEYQVAARMEYIHQWGGCDREAYAPIVGAGIHSTMLHYDELSAQIKDGDIVVIDVAGEYGGYAADVTRTLPANGKFTPRQREIYEIVLGAQNAALALVKPGVSVARLNQVTREYINTHGKDLHGQPLGPYFFHGLSHNLGLDVHDPGVSGRALEPGMVITIEPGIYIAEEKLGVRIEDDVLVTPEGYQLLTGRLPRDIEGIENMIAEGRSSPPSEP